MKRLEVEVVDVGNSLRSMEVSETQASEREVQYTNKLNEMSQRYREVSQPNKKQNRPGSKLHSVHNIYMHIQTRPNLFPL